MTYSKCFGYLLFAMLFSVGDVLAVDCSESDITISLQEEVDVFQATYGNGGTCDTITGNLRIYYSDITNLGPLSDITWVGGKLLIEQNDSLTNLDGFSGITHVGQNLEILENGFLTNIDGLSSLSVIGGALNIFQNQSLVDIDGLSSVTTLGEGILVSDNSSLESVLGLSGLSGHINGSLVIQSNTLLLNLDGLTGINSVGQDISLSGLSNLDGLDGVGSVGRTLGIVQTGLANLDGLSSLSVVGGNLYINSNQLLVNIDGLINLSGVGGEIQIKANTVLENLDGLSNLSGNINAGLQITSNSSLANLDGLLKLTGVNGSFGIAWNDALSSINGLSGLSYVNGGFGIRDNDFLTDVNGLSGLSLTGGVLEIVDNDVLANLDGLSSLETVGDNLTIDNNPELVDVDGLARLKHVAKNLWISRSPKLLNVDGLLALTYAGGQVTVQNNILFEQCAGLVPLLDQLDDGEPGPGPGAGGAPDVGLSVSVSGNHENCNSLEAIVASENSVTLSVAKTYSDLNPAEATVTLECEHPTTLFSVIDNNASSGSPAEFTVHRFIPGFQANCTATEVFVPNGYSVDESDCQDIELSVDGTPNCEIVNTQDPVQVVVNKVFRDDSNASVAVDLICDAGTVTADDPDASMADPAGFTVSDFPYGGAICGATESLPDGYFQESSTCSNMMISPGNGASCILINDIDTDFDGVLDYSDNCPAIANPGQEDIDSDGIGDACDPQDDRDSDLDGVRDEIDNCRDTPNPGQEDSNNNGIGDACEQTTVMDQQSQVVKAFETTRELEGDCRGVTEINGVLLAQVDVEQYGCELWKLDYERGHSLFADINPGPVESLIPINFGYYAPYNGWIYFGAYDGTDGKRLWRTDGQTTEMVEETEKAPNGFSSILTNRADFNGRYYFMGRPAGEPSRLYSLDGSVMRPELDVPLEANGRLLRISYLFDKLIANVTDDDHGAEPWVFDGNEFRILEDVVPGPESSMDIGYAWFNLDESAIYSGQFRNVVGGYQSVFYSTDGETVRKLPHSGPWMEPVTRSGSVYTSEASYGVDVYWPGNGDTGLPVLRVGKESTSSYEIPLDLSRPSDASIALLGKDVLALNHNQLFSLGEESATQIPFNLPSGWSNSTFEFVGTGAYFSHAYIKETSAQGDSRVWAWNYTDVGLLKSNNASVVTHAEYFRHVGNDIYFYGEDEQVGMALRRIRDVVIKPVPRMGAVTGSWYDPATAGQGLVLHPMDDKYTVISFYGFDNEGKPLWLTGLGVNLLKPGYTTEINMNITSGGNFGSFTPEQISELPWGTLKITFDTCSKATAEFDGLSGQQTMNMVRLARLEGINCYYSTPPAPETAGITGSWFDPATSGQGLVLHSMNDEQMVVSFYGYKNDGEKLWLIGIYSDGVARGEPLVVNMITASGGKFGGFTPDDITESPWGTLTINFGNCQNATATLDGVDGQQTMNMVKLAGLQGSELNCN